MLEVFRDRDSPPLRSMVPWAGEFAGKYLTSAATVLAATGDERLRAGLREFVGVLTGLQAEDGYLGPWPEGARLSRDAPNCKSIWDAWGHYHLMLGLLKWADLSADPRATGAASRIGDLLCARFLGARTPRLVDTGSAECNLAPAHGLCLLHEKTGRREYLDLAIQIVGELSARDAEGAPLAGDYLEQACAGVEASQMPKTRWEGLHTVQALAALGRLTGERRYADAFRHLWWSMAKGDRHNNGGLTSGEQLTGDPYDPERIETCCTVAWMANCVDMLALTGTPAAADELELAFYNSVLGMHSRTGRWATYSTPMNGFRRASAHELVFQAREGSPELNCCSVNSPRGLGLLSEWAVMAGGDAVALNYYGPADYRIPLPGAGELGLAVETGYPLDGRIRIRVNPVLRSRFALKLRIPAWSARTLVTVNGVGVPTVLPGSYLALERSWTPGDVIDVTIDLSLHFWNGERRFKGFASIYRGPVLLAFDHRYNLPLSRRDVSPVHDLMLDLPSLDAVSLRGMSGRWDDWLPPWLLLEFRAVDGRAVRLCDFASAGAAGTPYVSWLPVRGLPATPAFTEANPLRSVRV
jgi:hypothetical protein